MSIIKTFQNIVEYLVNQGVISKELLDEEIESWKLEDADIENELNMETIYRNRNLLDLIVRQVTLHESINNSSSHQTDKYSWND